MFEDFEDLYDDGQPTKNAGPRYDYKCMTCGHIIEKPWRETMFLHPCVRCEDTRMFKRVYRSFTFKPDVPEHFNYSVGQGVRSNRHFREILKRTSEEHSEMLNMDVNYQPIDLQDQAATGATGEGIYESNVTRSKRGQPLLSETPGEV